METFDFLASPDKDPNEPPIYIGPNKKSGMTPKKFAESVLEVYETLGAASWLIREAEADPKAFMALLTKMIPKSVQLDGLAGFSINLIDQFGASIEIQSSQQDSPQSPPAIDVRPQGAGHPNVGDDGISRTATGGSPTSIPTIDEDVPEYNIMDVFT